MYSVFDTMSGDSRRPRSTAPGFDDRLRALFPRIDGDPTYASTLAADMMMLRRELPVSRARQVLDEQRKAAQDAANRKRWWQFWRR